MVDYAMIRYENNTVRKIVKNIKPHPNALPVEYPIPEETELTHIISLNPTDLWKIDSENDKVIATYSMILKDFNNEKDKVFAKIRDTRKEKLNTKILTILNADTGTTFTVTPDRKTRDDIRDIVLQFRDKNNSRRVVHWEYGAHKWVCLDTKNNLSELIWKTICDYRDLMFSKQFELENEINGLDNNDFQELYNINIKSYNYFEI